METNLGHIDIELYDDAAPVTVDNFLNYVNNGRYNNTFINRSEPGFIIQCGGYTNIAGLYFPVSPFPPIANKFDPSRSNVRGTVAMAKSAGDPNSATTDWFFNLADNNFANRGNGIENLDAQNGGFTVFGRVIGDGMNVVDQIAALDLWDITALTPQFGSALATVPLINYVAATPVVPEQHLVLINRIRQRARLTPVAPATVTNVDVSNNPSPADSPAGVTFREGFFSFQLNGIAPGGSAVVALELPADYRPNTYYMYGPTKDNIAPHWYEFKFDGRIGAEFFGSNFVVLNFVDGERGDSDLLANGQITDPGAPGISTAVTPTPSSSSSGGGGCTLATRSSDTAMTLDYSLFALLFALGHWHRTRTRTRSITIAH